MKARKTSWQLSAEALDAVRAMVPLRKFDAAGRETGEVWPVPAHLMCATFGQGVRRDERDESEVA